MNFNNLYGVGNKKLSYDFYIPYQKLLIEFQGKQHEVQIDHFGGKNNLKFNKNMIDANVNMLKIIIWICWKFGIGT